jgi:hypothetical protein
LASVGKTASELPPKKEKKPTHVASGFGRISQLIGVLTMQLEHTPIAYHHFAGPGAGATDCGVGGFAVDSVVRREPHSTLDLHHLRAEHVYQFLNLSLVLCGHCGSPFLVISQMWGRQWLCRETPVFHRNAPG